MTSQASSNMWMQLTKCGSLLGRSALRAGIHPYYISAVKKTQAPSGERGSDLLRYCLRFLIIDGVGPKIRGETRPIWGVFAIGLERETGSAMFLDDNSLFSLTRPTTLAPPASP